MEPIWEILVKPAWYWLITIIPSILAYVGAAQESLPANQRSRFMGYIYNLLPYWVWLLFAAIAFVITILISTNNYVKKKLNNTSQNTSLVGSQVSGRDSYVSGRDTIIHPSPEKIPPDIRTGFLSRQNHKLAEKIVLHLRPLPPKPDFDELVKKERTRLLQKRQRYESDLRGLESVTAIIKSLSDAEYPERVERYLLQYREYEVEAYNFSVIGDRYVALEMALECRGASPASFVILELYFPEHIHFPPTEIELMRDEIIRRDGYHDGYKPHRPKEPDLFEPHSLMFDTMIAPTYAYSPVGAQDELIKGDYKISERNGANVITYEVQDLIQNHLYTDLVPIYVWLDNFERSTVISVPVKIYSRDLASPIEQTIEIKLVVKEKEELS